MYTRQCPAWAHRLRGRRQLTAGAPRAAAAPTPTAVRTAHVYLRAQPRVCPAAGRPSAAAARRAPMPPCGCGKLPPRLTRIEHPSNRTTQSGGRVEDERVVLVPLVDAELHAHVLDLRRGEGKCSWQRRWCYDQRTRPATSSPASRTARPLRWTSTGQAAAASNALWVVPASPAVGLCCAAAAWDQQLSNPSSRSGIANVPTPAVPLESDALIHIALSTRPHSVPSLLRL